MSEAVYAIDSEFRAEMDARIADLSVGDYDEVSIDYMGDIDGDSAYINNWNDVLATYAVLLTTDETNATDAITVTPEKVARLRSVFYEMNEVEYACEIIEEEILPDSDAPQPTPTPDGGELPEPETKLVLHILCDRQESELQGGRRPIPHDRSAAGSAGRDDVRRVCHALCRDRGRGRTWRRGPDADCLRPADQRKGRRSSQGGTNKLGAPYVWGAKGDSKFDCSGLAYWSIKQVDASLGDRNVHQRGGTGKILLRPRLDRWQK